MKRYLFNESFLLVLCLALVVDSESYYSINAPGVIKSNRKYSVVVALHKAEGPCLIRVGIEGPSFNEFKDVTLQPLESILLEFLPEKLIYGNYTLNVEGLSGCNFKNSTCLNLNSLYGPKIYIQTDKAVYRPQDLIKFHVVILDEHTRPLKIEEPINVEIVDKENNLVKQFNKISLINGVYSGQFQLSKYPVLGTWNIKVILGGKFDYSQTKSIDIDNYILPKFSVYLKTPSVVISEDGFIKVVIYGKYVFDKYVEGNATVELWNDFPPQLIQSKYVDIENLGFVEFDIKNVSTYNLMIKAKLSEKYTGKTESENKTIAIQSQRYNLKVLYDEIEFENNKPYRLKVNVQHWTGAPVLDQKTPVTMEHGNKVYESYLDENGVATFEFEHKKNAQHKFQFKDSIGILSNIYTNDNLMLNNREFYCRLKLLDRKPKLGKPVRIEVSSIFNIPYLMYTIMGHASLIHTEHVKVPPNQNSHIIEIMPSIEMIPESFIYVYYIHKGNLRYEEIQLSFPREFENQISLSAPKQVKPGEEVTLTLNAQPKSYVSILGVDLSVYMLDNTYDLYKNDIMSDLNNERSYSPMAAAVYPGILSGLLTLTNAYYPFENRSVDIISEFLIPIFHNFRQNFPETLMFDNFLINETITNITIPIPDIITTWRITAYSNHDSKGFGIVNGPTDITTIQSFFITLNLPNSVKRGEIVAIPITIFNYSNQTLDTEVVLYNSDEEFYFMESTREEVKQSTDKKQKMKNISIPSEKARTVNFLIHFIQAGDISLRVTALSSLYSDAVLQKLKVEPEGVAKELNQDLYVSLPSEETISLSFSLEMPVDKVPDSDYITFSVGGHYLVPLMENFDNLIQMPTGSGDLNMVNFAPSILIFQYLKANDKLSQEKALVRNLLKSIEIGYQQQLSFRHENGGYSVFGMGTDEEPNIWLTANVVRYLIKASQFVDVQAKLIETALKYLADQQKPSGEFRYTGYLLNPKHKNQYGLTAFVLLAFLENNTYAGQYQEIINNGIEFLNSNLNNTNDIYVLSLMATALKRTKHQNAGTLINRLKSYANENNGLKWWSGNNQNSVNDIEITAYAAITLLETPGDHTSILKWLIEQHNAKGGFATTDDTIVGLEALVKFSQIYKNLKNIDLKISYSARDLDDIEVANSEIHVNSNNILEWQT